MIYLDIAADGRKETLRFASKKDAERFTEFVKVYVDDSGAGNGYGAYWVWLDANPYWRPFIVAKSINEINPDFVSSMLHSIVCARTASSNSPTIKWSWEKTDGGIIFEMEELPARQRPAVGDMYRIPRSKMSADYYDELGYSEGRVLAEKDDIFTLRACHNEEPSTGKWCGEEVVHTISADRVMKINDWLSAMRYPVIPEQQK